MHYYWGLQNKICKNNGKHLVHIYSRMKILLLMSPCWKKLQSNDFQWARGNTRAKRQEAQEIDITNKIIYQELVSRITLLAFHRISMCHITFVWDPNLLLCRHLGIQSHFWYHLMIHRGAESWNVSNQMKRKKCKLIVTQNLHRNGLYLCVLVKCSVNVPLIHNLYSLLNQRQNSFDPIRGLMLSIGSLMGHYSWLSMPHQWSISICIYKWLHVSNTSFIFSFYLQVFEIYSLTVHNELSQKSCRPPSTSLTYIIYKTTYLHYVFGCNTKKRTIIIIIIVRLKYASIILITVI